MSGCPGGAGLPSRASRHDQPLEGTLTTEVDDNGKVVKTSSSCVDGLNICPTVPKPKKKGK